MSPSTFLPRLLFRVTLLLAAALLALVAAAPRTESSLAEVLTSVEGRRVLALFAHDAAVRRTAIAGAIGLCVAAFAFFRVPSAPRPVRSVPAKSPAPSDVVGA